MNERAILAAPRMPILKRRRSLRGHPALSIMFACRICTGNGTDGIGPLWPVPRAARCMNSAGLPCHATRKVIADATFTHCINTLGRPSVGPIRSIENNDLTLGFGDSYRVFVRRSTRKIFRSPDRCFHEEPVHQYDFQFRSRDQAEPNFFAFGMWLRGGFIGASVCAIGLVKLFEGDGKPLLALALVAVGAVLAVYDWRRALACLEAPNDATTAASAVVPLPARVLAS